MVNFKEYHLFFKVPGGSNNNQWEGYQLFPGGGGGPIAYFPIETHITCDFPGGGPDPLSPPLDPHLINVFHRGPYEQLDHLFAVDTVVLLKL